MPLYIYIAIFLLVLLFISDRLGHRMAEALADAVWAILALGLFVLLYYLFIYGR